MKHLTLALILTSNLMALMPIQHETIAILKDEAKKRFPKYRTLITYGLGKRESSWGLHKHTGYCNFCNCERSILLGGLRYLFRKGNR